MWTGFPYGRTQHVRRMRSSIDSAIVVIHDVSMRYFTSNVMPGSAPCPFLV